MSTRTALLLAGAIAMVGSCLYIDEIDVDATVDVDPCDVIVIPDGGYCDEATPCTGPAVCVCNACMEYL